MTRGPTTPEQLARHTIDRALEASGWVVQDFDDMNLSAGQGVAVREFRLTTGYADYILFVDGKAVGVLEAKRVGHTLIGVEGQAQKYTEGLPSSLATPVRPLPFMYLSTSLETRFANLLDPHPRSRRIFQVHRPETLAMWISEETLEEWTKAGGWYNGADDTKPATLRARLRAMPEVARGYLYPNQVEAIEGLEHSLSLDKGIVIVPGTFWASLTRIVRRLLRYNEVVRLPAVVHRGITAHLPSPRGPRSTPRPWATAGPPGSRAGSFRACNWSLTTQGPCWLAMYASIVVAFRTSPQRRHPVTGVFEAQYHACSFPCQRLACTLTSTQA